MTPKPGVDVEVALAALARAVRPLVADDQNALIVGIETGGAWLGERLHAELGLAAPPARLNVGFYRDDFAAEGLHPRVGPSRIETDVTGKTVILVDDVFYTGRTARAALNELFEYGRPARVRLAVLIDRGARELPLAADAVGARVELDHRWQIKLSGPSPLALQVAHRA